MCVVYTGREEKKGHLRWETSEQVPEMGILTAYAEVNEQYILIGKEFILEKETGKVDGGRFALCASVRSLGFIPQTGLSRYHHDEIRSVPEV